MIAADKFNTKECLTTHAMFKPLFSNPTHFTLGLVRLTCSLFQFRTPNELRVSGLTPNQEPYVSGIGLPFAF